MIDFGTMEERNRLAQRAVRLDGLEPWKALLFTVAPAAFVSMVEEHRDRAYVLTPSDESGTMPPAERTSRPPR